MSEFRRQHPIAAITQLAVAIRQNLVPIFIFVVVGSRNSGDFFWEIFLFGLASTFILGIVSWYRFTFRVENGELQIHKGIFVRKKLYLSKERIQVIDIKEGLIQRLFGLVEVEFKSAGGGTEKASISAITRTEAESLRKLLRSSDVIQDDAEEEIDELAPTNDAVQQELLTWKLSKRDLFYAALTSGNFGLIASILGAASGQIDQFITEENLDYLLSLLPGFSTLSVVLWMILIIFIISYLFSFLGVILRYSDFKIEKKENELLISSGLLERTFTTVPFNRIQALRFVEGVIRQPFGYGMLYVESAGYEQKSDERSIVLLPFVRKSALSAFLADFVVEFEDPEEVIVPPKKALFRYIRRPNYLVIPAILVAWFFWDNAWMLSALIIPSSLFGWLEFNDAKLSLNDRIMKLQYRVLAKTTAYVVKNRIQVTQISENPFQQRAELAHINVTAASGAGGKSFSLSDLDIQDAHRVYTWATK